MGSFLMQNNSYNIKAENELAVILANFDTNYIMNVMEDILESNSEYFDVISKANMVNSFEDNFKQLLMDFPEDKTNILDIRESTYENMIVIMARHFDFEFLQTEDMDSFSIARLLYDFFIANMNIYLIQFLTDIIIKENQNIYNALNMDKYKKDKDITTIYNKKIFDNPNLVTICSHIDEVLDLLCGMDFQMEQILNVVYSNNINLIMVFTEHIRPNVDFFKSCYCKFIKNPVINPLIITYLKLEIQRRTQTTPVISFNQ